MLAGMVYDATTPEYGQCQRQAFDYTGGEIDERHDTEQGNGIAPSRNDANERIQIVAIHVARQPFHRLIGFVIHQTLASLQSLFLVHIRLYEFFTKG